MLRKLVRRFQGSENRPSDTIKVGTRGNHSIDRPKYTDHQQWLDFLSGRYDKAGMDVLELGSRVVTGANCRSRFSNARYIGFDFYPGENVDVAGDAHQLSSYFPDGRQFDLIFSSAVFEHLHMPWIAAEQIARMLKLGGMAFVETHFSYAAHERPWNFFQFSEMGLRALFNRGLGFDVVDMGMTNPMVGFFSDDADEYLRRRPIPNLYCHSSILVQKVREPAAFDWRNVALDDVVDGTRYPAPASP
jgi:SAM-dependent methyltransferase